MDYDNVTFRLPLQPTAEARERLLDYADYFREDEWIRGQGKLGPDITVTVTQAGTKVEGSPHKHAFGESLFDFGPGDLFRFAAEVAGRLDLPLEAVLAGPVSRVDLSANLRVRYPVRDYLDVLLTPHRTTRVQYGPDFLAFKNSLRELVFYDKRRKVEERGLGHLLTEEMRSGHLLRFEVRIRRPKREFGRPITLGLLCDPDFWEGAVERWRFHYRRVPKRLVVQVPLAQTVPELRDGYAAVGVAQSGGRDRAMSRIEQSRRERLISPQQATRQRGWVHGVTSKFDIRLTGGLLAELDEAVREAVREALPEQQ
jgi:hypothetical protein